MSDFLTAKAARVAKPVTQSPSWGATLVAKAAWQAAKTANASDEPAKKSAYVALMRQCCVEAGIPWVI
jgi:hypothetical protein